MPWPLLAVALLVLAPPARAQDPLRPWLDWRTIATPNYRFHFPRPLEAWTRNVARHVESVDSAIASLVGYSPPQRVHVVVDDPFGVANGYALPFVDQPVTVWWATPADPRTDIGYFRTWGEMLAVHELTHIAHTTRPSRNPLQRQLWSSLPVNIGPISRKTPIWAIEGLATLVEGRITGTGRPNNAWRPAVLRQWAIEGHLPTYWQLSGRDDFFGGELAYLGGSAFLEWLVHRGGDSSLVHVWRRLTARRLRSFNSAFAGVYGDAPAVLYGRHMAELTRDAMAAKEELERAGLVEGELIQRLTWGTDDPALSPKGDRVAIVLRERERPARVVVWSTEEEPEDTAAVGRRLRALARDPEDVAERRFYPRQKKAEKTLHALNGISYRQPRWLPDGRLVLLTRWARRSDGSMTPDLYLWDTEDNDVRRVTRGAGMLNADPSPTAPEAVAMQCRWGNCDVAKVNLQRGTTVTILKGDPERSYYRPRYSPDGSRFVVSVSTGGRWRVLVADQDGSNAGFVDPEDGGNRYDAQWLRTGDSLVVVSDRGGIANLEVMAAASAGGSPRTLTRVTGAVAAPDVNSADGSIWFLALHSRGFDVRRLSREAPVADSVVPVAFSRFGFAGVQRGAAMPLRDNPVGPSKAYGGGPRHERWLPGGYASADGIGGFATIFGGDIVGRLNATVTGAIGGTGTEKGGSLHAVWRYPRPALEAGAFIFLHEPSLGRNGQPSADSLDATMSQGIFAFSGERRGEGWYTRARLGAGAGTLVARLDSASHVRTLGFGEIEIRLQQARGAQGMAERVRVHITQGHTRAAYQRTIASLFLETIGRDALPVQLGVTYGRLLGTTHPFERFSIGGVTSPVGDSSLLSQRYSMPVLPTGVGTGSALVAWRAAFPAEGWTWFYEGASASDNPFTFRKWNRAIGVDTRFAIPPVPAAFTPRVEMRGGAGYTLDAPFRKKVRVFLEMRIEP